jgi:DNA replication protein DnaC
VRRYDRASLKFNNMESFPDWSKIYHDRVLTIAILDHLLHHSTAHKIKGER